MQKEKTLILKRVAISVVALFALLQFILLLYYYNRLPLAGDAVGYVKNAISHVAQGLPYPTASNDNDIYIQSPGYVNFLAFIYCLFGSYKPILIFKVFFNLAILGELYYLGKHFFNSTVAYTSTILYCLMPVNMFASICYYNEIDYLFCALTGFALCLSRKNIIPIFLGGLFMAYAHLIRPIEVVLVACLMIYFLLRKYNYKYYLAFFVPYIIALIGFGLYCKSQTGYFYTSSSVTGHNLLFMVYDGAGGGQDHNDVQYAAGKIGYIKNLDHTHFAVKDSTWKARGINWIKKHPTHYLSSYIRGATVIMFRNDSWSIPPLSKYDDIKNVMQMPNPHKAHLIL